jgi:hypothetical protein
VGGLQELVAFWHYNDISEILTLLLLTFI